jgi:hypothetical protein
MRLLLWLVLVSCRGADREVASSDFAEPAAAASTWKAIEVLARPAVAPGPAEDLERALKIAKKHHDEWTELRYAQPPTRLDEYPEGVEALAALEAWVTGNGELPVESAVEIGSDAIAASDVGKLAIDSATPERDTSRLGVQLGIRYVQQARNLLEAQVGLTMISDAKRALGKGIDIELDIVRVLAAEASFARRSIRYFQTAEGRQKRDESLRRIGRAAQTKRALDITPAHIAAFEAFWLAALEGAQRGEPAKVSIERLRRAADTVVASFHDNARMTLQLIEAMKQQADDLASEESP